MKKFNINTTRSKNFTSAIRVNIFVVSYLIVLAINSSCDNFVEVELPNSQLTANAVFEEKATANAAMTDIYSKIRDAGLLSAILRIGRLVAACRCCE